ncbi:heme biosynthesis HemY N-terminal domain-containing protein [Marinomonas balearica]|uniref:HemY protein n=1 Tax=Marinomonas balearica TaxID=491947 RepID=A0A4R6M595_9GAMM|nr:heme biosynthesis HemY N-terminal domain-containing protein [Marinomonas balearica]TDO96483.1 HemY protein [Marinomonas balearica]
MRKFIAAIALMLVAGGLLGLLMKQDSGYVLIAFQGVTIETSLWMMIAFLILALVVLNSLKSVLFTLIRPSSSFNKVTAKLVQKRASKNTIRGMLELVGGNWKRAEKLLTTSAEKVPYPLINYIGAAYAASEQDDHKRSKELLRIAHQSAPEAEFAIGFAQSQIQVKQGHYESALATLLRLNKLKPKHRQILKMLVTVYTKLKDWDALIALKPTLTKNGIYDANNMLELERNAFLALLERITFQAKIGKDKTELIKDLESLWQKLDNLDTDNEIRQLYANTLIQLGDDKKAESFIRQSLNKEWSNELVKLYGILSSEKGANSSAKKPLSQAEKWLKQQGESANLHLTCGRLSQQLKLWGKAKDYYQSALSLDNESAALQELARLLKAMGDDTASQNLLLSQIKEPDETLKALPLP